MKSITLVRKWFQGKPIGLVAMVLVIGLPVATYGAYWGAYRNRIYPGVKVAGVNLGNRARAEAELMIADRVKAGEAPSLQLKGQDKSWEISLESIELNYDVGKTIAEAMAVGRKQGWGANLTDQWQAWWRGKDVPMRFEVNEEKWTQAVATIAAVIEKPVVPPTITVLDVADEAGQKVQVNQGEIGQEVNRDKLMAIMAERLERLELMPIDMPIEIRRSEITREQIEQAKKRAEMLLGDKLTLVTEEQTWVLGEKELVSWLSFTNGIDGVKVASYAATLATVVDRPAQNAAFRFENGRVIEFRPGKDGLKLDQTDMVVQIAQAVDKLQDEGATEQKAVLAVTKTPPTVKTDQVNNFGIKELLGRGVSTYRGSIAARVHNVGLSAQRISGTLVAPGETFSFNQALGEVAGATGYQQAYIIRSGRTVLDDGGGVCQTSTTLFRAVMEAGLPIVERRAHSYRVGYYEQNAKVGLDATVFSPTTDFKFLNDTPAHILIQTMVNASSRTLTIEIYGTSDGRKGEVINHKVWDQTPPPPDVYQDDPTMPAGQVKQVDWSAWGAKVKFDYRVKRGGEVIYEKTFYQVYQPWQAVFLRGTG